jgi:hypothetical protein
MPQEPNTFYEHEAEADAMRNYIKRIRVIASSGTKTVDEIRGDVLDCCSHALARPRTNGQTIDALKRRVEDLENERFEFGLLRTALNQAKFVATENARQRDAAVSELRHLRETILPTRQDKYNQARATNRLLNYACALLQPGAQGDRAMRARLELLVLRAVTGMVDAMADDDRDRRGRETLDELVAMWEGG